MQFKCYDLINILYIESPFPGGGELFDIEQFEYQ